MADTLAYVCAARPAECLTLHLMDGIYQLQVIARGMQPWVPRRFGGHAPAEVHVGAVGNGRTVRGRRRSRS